MFRFLHSILLNGLITLSLLTYSKELVACSEITLVSSNSHFAIVHRIEAAIYSQLNPKLKLVHIITGTKASEEPQSNSCLMIPIGSEALENILKTKTTVPILSILCRKNIFFSLLKKHHQTLTDKSHPITAIYLDQPLKRQINLIQCLISQPISLGILWGPNSLSEQELLQKLVKEKKIALTSHYINSSENPVAVLDGLLNEANVVLALPDNRVFTPSTARGMLLTAFHKRIPLIGYSKTFVNNGAIAAVYSTTKQLADQAAKEILIMMQNNYQKLPQPQYPSEFTIAVNYQVAGSLGMVIQSEARLKQAMDHKEYPYA